MYSSHKPVSTRLKFALLASALLFSAPAFAQGVKEFRTITAPKQLMPSGPTAPIAPPPSLTMPATPEPPEVSRPTVPQLGHTPAVETHSVETPHVTPVVETSDVEAGEAPAPVNVRAQPLPGGAIGGTPTVNGKIGIISADTVEAQPAPVIMPPDATISVSSVSHISLDTLGIYDEKTGGMPFTVWNNTSYSRVFSLMGSLPDALPSPTLRSLLGRLLLSRTQPPASSNIQQNVFLPRVEALFATDNVEQAQQLVDMVPHNLLNEPIVRAQYTAHLLSGDTGWVCGHIGSALTEYASDDAHWQKLSVFCQAHAGKLAEVQLALGALEEQGKPLDPAFAKMAETLAGSTEKFETKFAAPVALSDAAMLAIAGLDGFPEGYMQTAPLPIARLVAGNKKFADYLIDEASNRLKAAQAIESAESSGKDGALQKWYALQFARPTTSGQIVFSRLLGEMETQIDRTVERPEGFSPSEKQKTRRAFRLYSILSALGFDVDMTGVDLGQAGVETGKELMISPVLRTELAKASAEGRLGEAVLLMAVAGGQADSMAALNDTSVQALIGALTSLGLRDDAVKLAAESMIGFE